MSKVRVGDIIRVIRTNSVYSNRVGAVIDIRTKSGRPLYYVVVPNVSGCAVVRENEIETEQAEFPR